MKIHQIIFSPTGGTQRVSEILLFMLLTFFLAYIQTTEAKGQSSCFSYGASIMNGGFILRSSGGQCFCYA